MNKRPLIVIAIIFVLILLGAALIANNRNQSNAAYSPSAPKEAENGAPAAINNQPTITDTGTLANILLTEQFAAVQSNLISYLTNKYPNAKTASVTNAIVNNDGSVGFSLSLSSYNKTLAVTLIRLQTGDITLQIPADSYQVTLYIYDSAGTD